MRVAEQKGESFEGPITTRTARSKRFTPLGVLCKRPMGQSLRNLSPKGESPCCDKSAGADQLQYPNPNAGTVPVSSTKE
jgi:hypothetical protein